MRHAIFTALYFLIALDAAADESAPPVASNAFIALQGAHAQSQAKSAVAFSGGPSHFIALNPNKLHTAPAISHNTPVAQLEDVSVATLPAWNEASSHDAEPHASLSGEHAQQILSLFAPDD